MDSKMVLRRKAWVVLFCLVVFTFQTVACHKVTVTGAPPGVVAPEVAAWYQATGAVKTWSDASLGLTQSAINLKAEFPSADVYQKTLAALGKENQLGLQTAEYLKTVPQHFGNTEQIKLAGYLDQGLATLDDATQVGLLQIKNADEKAVVSAAVASLRASLKVIFALVKPAGTPVPASLSGGN